METHKEKIPSDSGIFHCKQGNEFSCMICTANVIYKDWKQHEATSCHIGTLERFNLIFTKSTNGIVCKVCGATLSWEALRGHAHWHKIVPWYEPTDRYKTFFRNHVIQWESEFYCNVCDQFFPEWSTAYIHIRDNGHKNLLKNQPAVNDFAFWTTTSVPYDILVSEAFVSSIKTRTVKCTICNCWNISLKNVPEHVKGQQHLHMKDKFVQDLSLSKHKKLIQQLTSAVIEESAKNLGAGNSGNNSENALKTSGNIPCVYIVEQGRNEFSCAICDLDFFSRKSVDLHTKATRHVDALKKYGCEQIWLKEQDFIYHCKCCDCPVLGVKNVHQHVRGVRHKNSLSELRRSSARNEGHWNNSVPVRDKVATKPESVIKPGSHFLPDSPIEKLDSGELLCNLCDVIILNVANVQNHIAGKTHGYGVEQFAENIVFKEGNDYHCKCCDCKIPGLENVYGHINGHRHANSLSALEQHKPEPNIKNFDQAEASKQPESVAKPNSQFLRDSHIEKLNSRELLCKLCDVIILSVVNVQNHLDGKNHVFGVKQLAENIVLKEGNNYHCKCCNCMIPGLDNVYGHISGYRHSNSLSALEQHKPEANIKNFDQAEASKQPEIVAKPNSQILRDSHIEKLNSRELLCKLCDVIILSVVNVQNHLDGKNHVFGVKQLAENIVLKEGNNYHCKCCDCMIPGLENVYGHINDYRHANSLSALEQHKPEPNIKNFDQAEASKQPEIVAKPNSQFLPDSHIEKLNSRELLCKLCDVIIPSVDNIQNHLAGKNHVFGLKQWAENIVFKEGNNYHCKCCDCMIPGLENVYGHINGYRHANSLSALEQHKPEPNIKNFDQAEASKQPEIVAKPNFQFLPDSHIEKLNSRELLCRLCDVIIPSVVNVQNHLAGKNHVFGVKQLAENIVFKEGNNYHCKCCNCMIPGLENVYDHIHGNRHANALRDMGHREEETGNKSAVQIAAPKPPETSPKPSSLPNYASLPNDHLEKRNGIESHYNRCDETIPGEFNIQKPLKGPNHVSGEKQLTENISFKESNTYHCRSCDCTISGPENLYIHLKCNCHGESLSVLEQQESKANNKDSDQVEPAKQPETPIKTASVKNDTMLPKDHIEKRNNTESHCKLCDETISGEFNLQKHLKGPNHLSGEKQLIENIAFKEKTDYHCRRCDCMIPGIHNIYVHIKGNRHAKTVSNMMDHNEKARENYKNPVKVETPKQPESAIKTPSAKNDAMMPKDHIEKRNSKESQCRLCNEAILGDSNIQKHLTSETHVLNAKQLSANVSFVVDNKYYCGCCDCTIPGIENIYRHINGIRHAKTLRYSEKHEKNVVCQNVAEVKMPKQPEENAKSTDKILSYDHIYKLTSLAFCCNICNYTILASSNVDDHIAGKQHAESLKIYSEAITTMKFDKHYCRHCRLAIYGIDNVYSHLQETRHKILANKANKTQRRESASSFDYIAFQAELASRMKQSKPKTAIPESRSPPEVIPCQICGVFYLNSSDFHSHLATHIGAELSTPKEPDNLEEMKESVLAAEQKDQNGNLSQQTAKLEELEKTELPNQDTKVSSNNLQGNGTTISANDTDSSNLATAELVLTKPNTNPEAKQRSPKKSSMQRIAQLLNPENDFIHDMRDKLRDTELGMKLCSMKEMKNIYCLICRKEVPELSQNYFKHLSSVDHCEYLEGMEKDHALFELVPGQFSEFDLVCQYMEEVSESLVHCHVCDTDVDNNDTTLKVHINDEKHEQLREKMHLRAKQDFEEVKSLLHCDWYTVHNYWCVPCSEYFETELAFAKHLRSTGHAIVMRKSKNGESALIHDFCSPCGLLWFGFRCTYANHCKSTTHKWVIFKRDNESQELAKTVKIFLAETEQYVDCTIKHFDQLSVTERDKEETLIRDLEMAVKSNFPGAKTFRFGSKASGFRTGDSDVEIFLDCGDMYDGRKSSEYETLYLMTTVHQCLCKDPQSWDVDKMVTACRSSVLKARHYATGLTCEISFENGLAVENMKLIKYFNAIFPACRKLILFLYQWLSLSGLAEPKGISNNALYWFMIFYLQKESSLPSVGSLIAIKNHSHLIAGWEVGVSLDFSRNEEKSSSLSIRELLINFFTFYAKFDYRYDVVSPLLGREVKKRTFADPQSLPKEMAPYINYMKNLNDPRPFKIDSAMCVQDPLILQRNLTEDVSKAYLSRFRACCIKSSDVLRSTMNRI